MTAKGSTAAAFFDAIRKGNDMAVDTAIGANQELLSARDEAGLSPVLVAAYAGHHKMAERIAAVEATMPDGLDIFDAAAVGNVGVMRALLSSDRMATPPSISRLPSGSWKLRDFSSGAARIPTPLP
jgi:hypothetical protein